MGAHLIPAASSPCGLAHVCELYDSLLEVVPQYQGGNSAVVKIHDSLGQGSTWQCKKKHYGPERRGHAAGPRVDGHLPHPFALPAVNKQSCALTRGSSDHLSKYWLREGCSEEGNEADSASALPTPLLLSCLPPSSLHSLSLFNHQRGKHPKYVLLPTKHEKPSYPRGKSLPSESSDKMTGRWKGDILAKHLDLQQKPPPAPKRVWAIPCRGNPQNYPTP